MVMPVRPVLVIHGGAGVMGPGTLTKQREEIVRKTMAQSLEKGFDILRSGGNAVEAVCSAVRVMEDCPQLNAGKGAVFTTNKTNELDAAVMEGHTGHAGAVSTLITRTRNPILASCQVLRKSPHVLLCGPAADEFAASEGLEMVDPSYFYTDLRYNQLMKVLSSASKTPQLDHNVSLDAPRGTVGAVALDSDGHLSAASSTGGMSAKWPGRVSDSSVVGAGLWADDRVAVTGTGNGDGFLRTSACKRVGDLVELKGMDVVAACESVVNGTLSKWNAGVIAADREGHIAMPFNTNAMFRAFKTDDSEFMAVYKE